MSHLKIQQPKVPPRNYQKALAVALYISSTLRTYDNVDEPNIAILDKQCLSVIKKYSQASGTIHFDDITDKLGKVWKSLADKNENDVIAEDDIPVLIECMCMLINANEFKNMFGIAPYFKEEHNTCSIYPRIVSNVLALDYEINTLLKTKPYVMMKPKAKVAKVKRPRDKAKKKVKVTTSNSNKIKYAQVRARVKEKVKDMVARAKEVKNG